MITGSLYCTDRSPFRVLLVSELQQKPHRLAQHAAEEKRESNRPGGAEIKNQPDQKHHHNDGDASIERTLAVFVCFTAAASFGHGLFLSLPPPELSCQHDNAVDAAGGGECKDHAEDGDIAFRLHRLDTDDLSGQRENCAKQRGYESGDIEDQP